VSRNASWSNRHTQCVYCNQYVDGECVVWFRVSVPKITSIRAWQIDRWRFYHSAFIQHVSHMHFNLKTWSHWLGSRWLSSQLYVCSNIPTTPEAGEIIANWNLTQDDSRPRDAHPSRSEYLRTHPSDWLFRCLRYPRHTTLRLIIWSILLWSVVVALTCPSCCPLRAWPQMAYPTPAEYPVWCAAILPLIHQHIS